jgi:hypothetical protein
VLDVADLESEADHEYALLGARQYEEVAREGGTPDGDLVVDGGRTRRVMERFVAHLRPGIAARCIVRLQASPTAVVHVLADEQPIGSFDLDYEPDWTERDFEVPKSIAGERTRIELRVSGGVLTTFHYWFVRSPG